MKILVTGGAGFIGSQLVEKLLAADHEIICIDNFDPYYSKSLKENNISNAAKHSRYQLYDIDIRDYSAIVECFQKSKIDLVVHLAARAGIRPSLVDPGSYYETNLIGTLNILEAMKACSVSKLIFASSSSVYGNNSKVPFAETDNVDSPISPYAASKKAGELLCYTYHHLYRFDVFCLRFFTVYGPRQRPDLAIHKFTNSRINNQVIELFGDGRTSRDYTYIDDIVDGIISAISNLNGYEVINLGESRTIELLEVISTIEDKLKIKAITRMTAMQPGDVNVTYADISKARRILNYAPSWSFNNGIERFIQWKLS